MERRNDYFDKGLGNVIGAFEKAREWADLSNCLQKVKKQIEQNKGLNIPRQKDLAKRLAQCLNPEINVIHQLTLEVYREVFERELELMEIDKQNGTTKYERKSSIALFFSGLFNFYQFAAFEVKQSFLGLISDCMIKMEKELILSLPGFMLCMLPALEDQNGEIIKKVEYILQETEKIVGTSEFYGEIWKAMLRTSRARLSAIRYLEKRIPKDLRQAKQYRDKNIVYLSAYTIKIIEREVQLTKDENKLQIEDTRRKNMELHDYFFFYYPNKSKLVLNALIAGLSTSEVQVYVNRATLDFMVSHMPINSEINSIQENISLVECATIAYLIKDFATQNKISNWLFGHIDEEMEEVSAKDPAIITIVESQKNLFNKSMDLKHIGEVNQRRYVIGESGQAHRTHGIEKLITDPIQILLRITSDEENTTVPILKNLSIHFIKFIRFHYFNNKNIKDMQKFESTLTNLLEQISDQYGAVLESLADKLQQEINNLDYTLQQDESLQQLESIDLISFAILDMKKLQKRIFENNDSKKFLTYILQNLLKGLQKISNIQNNHQNLELMLPSLEVIDQILIIFDEIDNGKTLEKQKKNELFKNSIDSFNSLFVQMSNNLIQDNNQEGQNPLSKQQFDTFKKYNNIMLKIVKYQDIDSQVQEMPEWLDILIQSSKTPLSKNQNICIVSAEIFNDILKQQKSSIMHIQRLIIDPNGQQTKFSQSEMKDYKIFYKKFIDRLQFQGDTSEGKNGNIHCKEIIQNLWFNLDKEIETQKIVDLLKAFDLHLPRIFSDVVVEELGGKSRSQGEQGINKTRQNDAIKKFAIFWKLAQGYPEYKPFESPSPEMNGKKYVALHNMINFLEDSDPTLRLSCRSWLSQNKQFKRILDPIIEEFIQNSNFFISEQKKVFINEQKKFETEYVIQNFGKLRNIILNTQDDIIEYLIMMNCTQYVLEDYKQMKGIKPVDDPHKRMQSSQIVSSVVDKASYKLNYLDILVETTLQFIRAEHAPEALYQQQVRRDNQQAETLTVNASACEFMELILKQVEKHGIISNKIAHVIVKPLIDTFQHLIEKKNYAMQVNILNLLHQLLNECNFQGQKSEGAQGREIEDIKQKCIAIFSDKVLIDSIILGLKCDQGFVRQKFIKFVEMYVPYLRKFTKDNDSFKDDFKTQIEKLLDCFCNLLKRVDVSFFSSSKVSSQPFGQNIRQDHSNKSNKKKSSIINIKDEVDELENLIINQETDIVLIIDGVQIIINTCLDIKNDGGQKTDDQDEDGLDADEQIRKQKMLGEANKKTGFFSMFSGNETSYFVSDTFTEVKKVIYDKIQNILIACIYCWNPLDIFNWSDYHFTRFGMFAYNQEDNRRILEKLRRKTDGSQSSKDQENKLFLSLDQILKEESNPIHMKVMQLLRSLAKKTPDQFIEGALNVWLRKSLLGRVDIHLSYQKIMQMLVCVYQATENPKTGKIDFIMPVYQVVNSMIKYINSSKQSQTQLVNGKRWGKNVQTLSITQTSSETLLNSFLYAYLTYNPSMFDQLIQNRSEDKMRIFKSVYESMSQYFNLYKFSRNPFTIQWLLEILNIISIKFNLQESRLDTKLKKDYHDFLNNALTNCASIITETFNIQFNESQIFNFALPPTMYEFLWRYEYMAFKNSVTDGNDPMKKRISQPEENFQNLDERINGDKFKNSSPSAMDIVAQNGPIFFDQVTLKKLVDQQFEYQHSTGNAASQNSDQSIFQNLEILMKDRSTLSHDYIKQSDFMEKVKFAVRGECNPTDMLIQSKYFTIITLKQILCQLLVNLVGTGDTEKCNKTMQILLLTTLQILQNDNKNAEKQQDVMNEFITDFFASVVEKAHQIDPGLIKPYKKEIVDLFHYESFFSASMVNLKQWQKIMKYFIDGKPDEMLELQMEKWNIQGGLFADNNKIITQKCYAMKRIAFLIFSCIDDDFLNQLDQLLKKMIEVFKQGQKVDIKQRLFLIFLTRVMLMRLNINALTETLRKLWPHLLNELISVFEIKQDEHMDKDNTDLTIEAIKLVELLASLNIEDFQMNQWIFLIDGYGMQLENNTISNSSSQVSVDEKTRVSSKMEELKKKQQRPPSLPASKSSEINNDVFKTFIVRFIGNQEYSFYNVEVPQDGTNRQHDLQQIGNSETDLYSNPSNSAVSASPGSSGVRQSPGLSLQMRNLNLQESKQAASTSPQKDENSDFMIVNKYGEFDNRLQEQACSLQQSINDSNVLGNEFNRQEAEAKIEQDFLKNDSILKL